MLDDDNLIKKPFVPYVTKSKNEKFKPIVIRSNPQMDAMIEDLKDDLVTDGTSTVVKKAFLAGYKVIHHDLGKDFLRGLLNKKEGKKHRNLRELK